MSYFETTFTKIAAIAKARAAPRADNDATLCSPVGFNITMTPKNPIKVATVLFMPTFSFKKIAARGTTNSALEKRIAWASASGILTMA